MGRRTGEDFHPPLAQSSSRAPGCPSRGGGEGTAMLQESARGAPRSRRLLPEISFIALGFVRRWRGRRPWPRTRSGRGSPRARLRHGRTSSPGRAAFSYEDFQGANSVFLCTSRLQVFELSVQFVRIFAYCHPCCFEFTVCFLNAQFH